MRKNLNPSYYPFFAALSLLVLSACSKTASVANANSFQPVRRDLAPAPQSALTQAQVENMRVAASGGTLSCAFTGECNPAVAMISVITEQGLERCTGFLISPNQVITNDHCVNKSISLRGWESRSRNLPCHEFIYIHFPGQTADEQGLSMGCEEVEVRSGENGIASLDYSVLRLSSPVTDRTPLKISPSGTKDLEGVSIVRVQMTNDGTPSGFNGVQTEINCQTSYRTYLYPALNSLRSPLMTYGDCAIQAGNSGSPVLNSNGEVTSIIQGYLTPSADEPIASDLIQNLLDPVAGELAVGTQVSCISELGGTASPCDPVSNLNGYLPSDYLTRFGRPFPESLPKLAGSKQWSRADDASDFRRETWVATPRCMNSESFSADTRNFRKGINRFFQAEWRETERGKSESVFSRTNEISRAGSLFKDPNGKRVSIPACL